MYQNRSPTPLFRIFLSTLIVVPLGVMGILAVTVLLPALRNPESKFYSSKIGYPALQRLNGKPIAVQTAPVTLGNLQEATAAPGESVALQQVEVRPLVSGTVENTLVVEGQQVRKGQPLVQIQQLPFQLAVDAARKNLAIASINFHTEKETVPARVTVLEGNIKAARRRLAISQSEAKLLDTLARDGAISKMQLYNQRALYAERQNDLIAAQQALIVTQSNLRKQMVTARLQMQINRIELQTTLKNLNYATVRASESGLVSQVAVTSGEIADLTKPVVTLSANTVFEGYVDQARIGAVKIGDRARVRLLAYPGRSYQGKVIRLNPTVRSQQSSFAKVGADHQYTYSVWVKLDDLTMPPGLQGYVEFTPSRTVATVPESAVTHLSAGEGIVVIARSNRAAIRRVKLGRIRDNKREIIGGLKVGERVIINPKALKSGDLLRALPEEK
ncbi:MAG: Macrolide export protein MacA [Chroococcidiopsis cubana SAG 39.79]|uniref:Secretion protein HlyD n=1 Tax=Chroococcidiopsis cubana SAG 39.79 TaxID=388085 RepID=A0AB37URW1_9CYAN|nr:efflux RND transporter periplasmic adaptor subunit [Chroococcidiopsis cubana]MDZ4877814.1 Macrolide export protein MacA [Chroococcidiopsis cubana SAG 39.79]PSB66274.1 secretion protein HlyD [Chroococcidiopsis cubana CCALA 043]RUT14091.1 hypothetical protein DSM107010_05740 [Chroococcidiopsis cubana SAG 39.79]